MNITDIIFEQKVLLLIVSFPIVYFITRDIYGIFKEKKRIKEEEQRIIDSEKRILGLVKDLNSNREHLIEHINNIQKTLDLQSEQLKQQINEQENTKE